MCLLFSLPRHRTNGARPITSAVTVDVADIVPVVGSMSACRSQGVLQSVQAMVHRRTEGSVVVEARCSTASVGLAAAGAVRSPAGGLEAGAGTGLGGRWETPAGDQHGCSLRCSDQGVVVGTMRRHCSLQGGHPASEAIA